MPWSRFEFVINRSKYLLIWFLLAQEDTSEATHDTISTVREVEIGESYLNINAVSAVSNAMTDSMTLNTESVTTITDMARKSLN